MEIGTIGMIVDNVTGAEGRDDLALGVRPQGRRDAPPGGLGGPPDPDDQVPGRRPAQVPQDRRGEGRGGSPGPGRPHRERSAVRPVAAAAPAGRTGAGAVPWAWSFAAANEKARADGKLIMVVFYTGNSRWERLDAEVFPRPDVAEAIRPFVPVKVDAEDGEGRPLAEKYKAHVGAISPMILFLDPANREAEGGGVVARIPGMIPAGTLVEGLQTIARLPRDIDALVRKAHPDDGDAMRQLATALAMRGRIKDATALIDRAWGPGADPAFDRWAAVYNALGIELMMRLRGREAADWFNKASGVAKRPIDVYNAHLGAGFAALLQTRGRSGHPGVRSGRPGATASRAANATSPRAWRPIRRGRSGRRHGRTSRPPHRSELRPLHQPGDCDDLRIGAAQEQAGNHFPISGRGKWARVSRPRRPLGTNRQPSGKVRRPCHNRVAGDGDYGKLFPAYS